MVVVSGVAGEVTLLFALCRPLEEPLDLDHSQWEDIHVVAGALKLFFRELPEPLFPSWIFQKLVEALSESLCVSHTYFK